MTATIDGPVVASHPPTATQAEVETVDASIIVSCHDYGEYVGDAVRSALAQDGVRVEVIVVDDGSTDDSPAVLDGLVRGHPGRIELITRPNRGQASAMNAGFARARAPVVLFLDADDVLHPRTAARCVDALRPAEVARVQFPMRIVDRTGRPTGRLLPDDPKRLPAGDLVGAVLSHPDDLTWQPTSGNAFASAALERILPMPELAYRTCADHYLSNLSALHGEVVVLDGVGADYRVHGANADHRDHLDVGRLRTVIGHTIATHTELARVASDLGHEFPTDPLDVPSVTFFVNRLVSLRLAPDRHPLHGDRRLRLVLAGAHATRRRQDLSRPRRAAMVGWFAAMGVAPPPIARTLAELAVLGGWRRGRSAPATDGADPVSAEVDPVARRADWRFLLPAPVATTGVRRAVVRGVPLVPTGSALYDLELAAVVDRGDGSATASVVVDVTAPRPDIGAVAAALAPGGHAWVEVDRRRRGARWQTPARLARRAGTAGLAVEATYAIGPSPEHARRFIPLDHAGAVGWYLRTQVVPATWVQAIGLGVLRGVLATVGSRPLAALVPAFGMVLSRPPAPAAGPSTVAEPAAVTAARAASGVPYPDGAGHRTLLLTSGQDEASRAVLLPFAPGAREPSTVVKVAARTSFGPDTVAELDRLADLATLLPAALASAVPRAGAQAQLGRLVLGSQTPARGRPIEVRVRSATAGVRRTVGDLDAATDWLIELHRATRADVMAGDGPGGEVPFWRRWVLDPLHELRREVVGDVSSDGIDPQQRVALRDLDRLEARSLAAIALRCGEGLPQVERHHDYVPCNVLRARTGISVVDWEIPPGREPTGPALVDLLLFVTFWYGAAHRSASPAEDLHRLDLLLGPTPEPADDPFHAPAWSVVARYCDALDLDLAVAPLALTALWLERHASAALRADRLRAAPPPVVASPVAAQLAVLARRWGATGGPWLGG